MKVFNEKHESIINVRFVPKVSNPKDGDIVPHAKIVNDVTFFQPLENGQYLKVWMSKDMILDIALQITEIESQVIDMRFDSELPF